MDSSLVWNKELFEKINNSLNELLRKEFGPPKPGDRITAQVAMALVALGLRYYAQTGAPKDVILQHVKDLLFTAEEQGGPKSGIEVQGSQLILLQGGRPVMPKPPTR